MGANENFWKLAQERMESNSNKKKIIILQFLIELFKTQKVHCFNSWCFYSFFSLLLCFRRKSTRKFEPKITYFLCITSLEKRIIKNASGDLFWKKFSRSICHSRYASSTNSWGTTTISLKNESINLDLLPTPLFLFHFCESLNPGVIS